MFAFIKSRIHFLSFSFFAKILSVIFLNWHQLFCTFCHSSKHRATSKRAYFYLNTDGRTHHVERDGAQPVLLEEGHEEAEADEDHDVDILEHWNIKSSLGLGLVHKRCNGLGGGDTNFVTTLVFRTLEYEKKI